MKEKLFDRNEAVFHEGDMGTSFYRILEGKAGIYVNYGKEDERKLTEMGPGKFIGEMGVIEAWPRSATVVAEEPLKVIEITEENLNDYFAEDPDSILSLMKHLSGRIRELTEEYNEVNAFLKEKQEAAPEKKESFLARLKKYREISAYQKKNLVVSVEELIREGKLTAPEKAALPVKSYSRGQVIFREGEEGNYMYAIYGGSVGIYSNYGNALEKKLTTLYTNSFFGEMGLIEQEKRSATAVVEEDDTVLETISADSLQELFKKNPGEIDMILSHLSNRLRRLTLDYVAACEEAAKDA